MEKLFKLKANGTTVRTEILAGLTTFMTMAYIIALNPNLLTNFAVGTPLWNGVFLATCIASAIGTICMAFFANKPFVMAPGMGLNSFFAVVVANIAVINECEYESAFQAALVIILVEGIVFLILTLLKVREKIVEAIPLGVRYGIAPAIGLMLMNVGLGSNVGIYAEGNGFASPFYMMRDFFGALTPSIIKGSMGEVGYHTMVLTVVTAFLGVFVMVVLAKKGVKAAVLLGIVARSGIRRVALDDRAVHTLDHRPPKFRGQEVLVALFAGMQLHGDVPRQLQTAGFVELQHIFRGDIARKINLRCHKTFLLLPIYVDVTPRRRAC